ncbi:MAG: hypothetical protein R2786_05305 [Flavobacteriaceae bacterium]
MQNKRVKINFRLQFITGLLIALHGLFKIFFISDFTDFIVENLYHFIPSETFLIIVGSFIPFLEFFAGLLILVGVKLKQSIILALVVLTFLALVVVSSKLYIHLLVEVIMLLLLTILSFKKNYVSVKQYL